MYAKTSEEIIHTTRYLQSKPVVAVDPDVLLHFPNFPFSFLLKIPSTPHSSKSALRKLKVSKSMRERIE